MAGSHYFRRGGSRGRGRGYNMLMWENQRGKPPTATWIKPDPSSGFYKLHVRNIPRKWSEATLMNAFRKISEPASLHLHHTDGPKNWAFVEFKTYREASQAIKSMNENVFLDGIAVSFAREKANFDTVPFLDDMEDDPLFEQLNKPIEEPVVSARNSHLVSEGSTSSEPKMFSKTIKNDQVYSTNIQRHRVNLPVCSPEEIKILEKAIFERVQHILKNSPPVYKCEVCSKSTNQSCGNCCIHYCSRQCQTQDWPSHSRICIPVVNNNTKTNSQANLRGSDASLRQSELTNGYRAAHESESNFRSARNRYEEKSSRNEDNQRSDKRNNDNFRQNNRFGSSGSERNDSSNFGRDRNIQQTESELPKTMFEERKSRFMSSKQIKNEVKSEASGGGSWDSNRAKRSSKNLSGSTSQQNSNHLSTTRAVKEENHTKHPFLLGDEFILKEQEFKSEIERLEPVVKPTTCQDPTISVTTKIFEPVATPSQSQVPTPSVAISTEQTSSDLKPGMEEEVEITHIESPGVFYVYKTKKRNEVSDVMKKLNDPTTAYTPFSAVENGLCALKYQDEWSRARVTSLSPLTVLYIDFGNSEIVTADRLFTLPDSLAAKPPFGIKVKLADGTPTTLSLPNVYDNLCIKAINKVDDYWIVQVAGVNYPEPATASPSIPVSQTPQVIKTEQTMAYDLKQGTEEEVVIIDFESSGLFYVHKTVKLAEYAEIHRKLNNPTTVYTPVPPVEQGLYAVQYEGEWSRVRVTSLNPLTVLFIDFGNSETVTADKLFALSDSLAASPSFGIKMKLADGTPDTVSNLNIQDKLCVKAINKVDDYWIVQVAGVNYPEPATASPSIPVSQTSQRVPVPTFLPSSTPAHAVKVPANQTSTKLLPADMFTKVSVRHVESTHLAVTPVSLLPEFDKMSARIQTEADSAAPHIPPLTKCLVHSRKLNCWCRGRVTQQEPLMVKLVDYGIVEAFQPDDLRQLTPPFASVLPYVVYIKPNHGTVEELSKKSVLSVKPLTKDESGFWIVDVDLSEKTEEIRPFSSGSGPSAPQPHGASIPSPDAVAQQVLPTPPASPAQAVAQPQPVRPALTQFLSKDQFTSVYILCKDQEDGEGGTYYVGTAIDINTMRDMSKYFKSVSKDILVSPQIGDLGLASYDSEWYRVKVISLSPLKVFYIDYGNTETLSPEDLMMCPASHKDVPPLAHKVRLTPGTNLKYFNLPDESEISIKPVSESPDGSVLGVQVEGETYQESVTPVVSDSLRETPTQTTHEEVQSGAPSSVTVEYPAEVQYIADLLKKDFEVEFVPNIIDPARNMLRGTLLSTSHFPANVTMIGDIQSVMQSEPSDPNFTPIEGEAVMCKGYEVWQRAQFLEFEEKQWLSLVDYGALISYEPCKKTPSKYTRAPFMAAVLKLSAPTDMELLQILECEERIIVKVKEVESEGCLVQVHVNEREFSAVLGKWKYDPLVWPLPLLSGSTVTISKILDSNTFVVVPADDDMQFHQTIQIECLQANKSNQLQLPPKVGDHVVTQHKKIFHRAKVERIDINTNLCTLYNIDSGIEFQASLSSLKPIPPVLCKLPCKAIPIVLKDVEKVMLADMPDLGKLYIKLLEEQEKQFRMDICTSLGLVTLTSVEDGHTINEKLKELLTRNILPDANGKFTMDCLAQLEPPMNQELELAVTLTDPLYVQNVNTMKKFYDEVHNPLQLHARSDSAPYNPCTDEICIVKFGEEWYRAICGKETNTGVSHVFLVDFGNCLEVRTSDIRKIIPQFLSHPYIGLFCEIKDLPSVVSFQLRARLNEILAVDSVHAGIIESKENDKYCVNLPGVLTLLRSEGLVP